MLLIFGLSFVLLSLVVVVVDVSVVFLAQRGVASAADGAAVSAAQQLDEASFYARGLAGRVPLDEARVAADVATYASSVDPPTNLQGSTTPDEFTVVVRGSRRVSLPFGAIVGQSTVTIDSVARATSPVLG